MAQRPTTTEGGDFIALGHVARAHGVHGAVVITPYTDDEGLILRGRGLKLMSPEGLERPISGAVKGKAAAQGLIAKLPGVTDRDAAQALAGWQIGVARQDLPPAGDDEVYWADLVGLAVETADGRQLGVVSRLMEAGAGLLLCVTPPGEGGRELLLPFQKEFIVKVDLPGRLAVLNPPPGLLDL